MSAAQVIIYTSPFCGYCSAAKRLLAKYGVELTEIDVALAPGDKLLLYTDGVTDALTSTGERFGKERMIATIEATRAGTAHDLVGTLSGAVSAFCRGVPPADDVTIVSVGRH